MTERWLRIDSQSVIRPFAVVELDLLDNIPDPPHTEDWVVDRTYHVIKEMAPPVQRRALLERTASEGVESIFGADIHRDYGYYVTKGEGQRSLGTIVPAEIHQVLYGLNQYDTWDFRIWFTDRLGQWYGLRVTDLAFRYFLDCRCVRERLSTDEVAADLTATLQRAEVFLRVGLARGWSKLPDRCFLQITGVYSFPDYLNGQCFADLALSLRELAEHRRSGMASVS